MILNCLGGPHTELEFPRKKNRDKKEIKQDSGKTPNEKSQLKPNLMQIQ